MRQEEPNIRRRIAHYSDTIHSDLLPLALSVDIRFMRHGDDDLSAPTKSRKLAARFLARSDRLASIIKEHGQRVISLSIFDVRDARS